jgi:predicted MFS family arabinose efflux permease
MSLWQAARFILTIRTNVVLIVASALGYFYFSGMQGFAVEFAKKHYSLSQSAATSLTIVLGVGALVGVLAGGRLADRLLRAGRLTGRIDVGGVSVLCAGVVFVPALITKSVGIALPLLMVAALFLGATNPPMDAARLDIMHPQLWGRAEATRSVLRNAGTAMAPLLFGVLAQTVFGGDNGLEYAFLTCLTALFASAVITLVFARRTYPGDVAAASRSMDTISAT